MERSFLVSFVYTIGDDYGFGRVCLTYDFKVTYSCIEQWEAEIKKEFGYDNVSIQFFQELEVE